MKIIVLAGGQGKRLWPLSTEKNPKQFIHLGDHESFLKKTVRRFVNYGLTGSIYIVTNKHYAERSLEELKEFDPQFASRILIEPHSKNTAPAIAWSLRELYLTHILDPQETVVTIPIDHIFSDEELFLEQLMGATLGAQEIVAFGVPCRKPVSGYGYIRKGLSIGHNEYQVEKFIEKPTIEMAEDLLGAGEWLWNVGVYMFSRKTYLESLEKHHPLLYKIASGDMYEERLYAELLPVSIDDAVIAHAMHLKVRVLAHLEWSDIGSWDNLCEHLDTKSLSLIFPEAPAYVY